MELVARGYHSLTLFDSVAKKDPSLAALYADLLASLAIENDKVTMAKASKGWAALKKLCESSNKALLGELPWFISCLSSDGSTSYSPITPPLYCFQHISLFFVFGMGLPSRILQDFNFVSEIFRLVPLVLTIHRFSCRHGDHRSNWVGQSAQCGEILQRWRRDDARHLVDQRYAYYARQHGAESSEYDSDCLAHAFFLQTIMVGAS